MADQTFQQLGVSLERLAGQTDAVKRAALRTVSNYQLRAIRENFRNERDPSGAPWAPLSPLTQRTRGHSRRMLYGNNDPNQLIRSVPEGTEAVRIGTNDPILGIHHHGARQTITRKQSVWMWFNLFGGSGAPGPGGMVGKVLVLPRRRGIGFGPADIDQHAEIVARHLEQAFEGQP